MPSFVPPKKNTAYTFYVGLYSQTDSRLLQANPTLAAGDVKVAIDDGAPANLATLPVVDADFTKRVKVVLSAAEMNGDNISIIFADAAGAEWCDQIINLQTTSKQIDDLATQASVDAVDDFIDTEVAAIKAKTDALPSDPADQSAVEAAITAATAPLATAAALAAVSAFVDTEVAAIKAKTDNLPAAPAAVGDIPTTAQIADAVHDEVVDGALTFRQSTRLQNANAAGKLSGAATATNTIRDPGDTKNRIVATVDADGNRTAITTDVT